MVAKTVTSTQEKIFESEKVSFSASLNNTSPVNDENLETLRQANLRFPGITLIDTQEVQINNTTIVRETVRIDGTIYGQPSVSQMYRQLYVKDGKIFDISAGGLESDWENIKTLSEIILNSVR